MPAWLIQAFRLLGGPTARGLGIGLALPDPFNVFGGDGGGARRRRRRRALTQSDRNDIAFISATLGAPAGQKFALIIASRIS